MTNPHAKAVEAAAGWYQYEMSSSREDAAYFARGVITAYLAAMRAEGWVLVRDVGERTWHDAPEHLDNSGSDGWAEGHNACRASMLKGAGDD